MKKGQDTRGYDRYLALDIHREYNLVGGWNEKKEWVLTPRCVSIEKFPEWAKKNIRPGDVVVLETTTNVWTIYDIVAPLANWVLVANATEVWELAGARVKTDKEDIKRLLKLLVDGIVPEVWVPPDGSAGIACFHFVSESVGYNVDHDPQSPAEPAA